MNELLFEIGTEEIPAGYLAPACTFMADFMKKQLQELELNFQEIQTAYTPRRLILVVTGLQEKQKDKTEKHLGPPKAAAFDQDGEPTQAAKGFARSKNISVDDLQITSNKKGEYLLAIEEVKGKQTVELLPDLLSRLITAIPFPKSMHWADSKITFARPIKWLLAIYKEEIIPLAVESIESGNNSMGHRFMAPDSFSVKNWQDYLEKSKQHHLMVLPEERREQVIATVKKAIKTKDSSARVILDDNLVNIVTNLVEYPHGVCGSFGDKFLELPREALITSMREHQKYFPVEDEHGNLLPLFVAVNNTEISDLQKAAAGHERVLRARLEDGLFFFQEDKKYKLADRINKLDGITFQQKLGSMADKVERIKKLSVWLNDFLSVADQEDVIRASELAKADLLTEMVGEFPSLQGIIGKQYALLDGEKEGVATAIAEHYMPLRAGGKLPETGLGALIGLADRMDTLAGCFLIGEKPSGSKDSFGLRRQAIGLINIINHFKLPLQLSTFIEQAMNNYSDLSENQDDRQKELQEFIRLRFGNELISSGHKQEVVEAAISSGFDDMVDCVARIKALSELQNHKSFIILASSFKRVRNITKDNKETEVNRDLLQEEAEQNLLQTINKVEEKITPLLTKQEYQQALTVLLEIKDPVDTFFNDVMVMCEDEATKRNRLNLLSKLREMILQIGDISLMHVK